MALDMMTERMRAGRAVERTGNNQELAVQNESHGRGGKTGVGIEQRDDGGHIGSADGDDHEHAEDEGYDDHHRERVGVAPGCHYEVNGNGNRNRQQRQIDEVLPLIGNRALGQNLLQFPRRHQTAGEGQRGEDDLQGDNCHHEAWNVRGAEIELGAAHQGHAECAEGVAERGSLRNGRHVHQAQRNPNTGAQHEGDDDPLIVDDAVMQQGPANGQGHADFAGSDAALGGGRTAQPFQRKNKENAGNQVDDLDDLLISREVGGHGFVGRLDLNILSMRSVIRKPPTTLLVAAITARTPNTNESVLLCSPTRHDGADDRDGVEGIGKRHERRVEQRRDSPDDLKSDEGRQHKNVESVD